MEGRNHLVPSVMVIGLIVATFACVVALHARRSPFYDETWVVEYAGAPTAVDGLAMTIQNHRPVSLGYLMMMRAVASVADTPLWLYRVPSAIFCLVILLLVGWLVMRWCGVWSIGVAGGALLLLLGCPILQRYTTEIKQYIPSAALTLGLVVSVDRWVYHSKRAWAWAWFLLAVASILGSFSAWFAVVGTGVIVFAGWLIQGNRDQIFRTVAFGVGAAALATLVYMGFNRHIAQSGSLATYWAHQYLPRDLSWPAAAWETSVSLFEQAWYRYEVSGAAMVLLACAGWGAWCCRQPIAALATAATVVITLTANMAQLWPLGIRVNLQLILIGHVCLLAGPAVLCGWVTRQWLIGSVDQAKGIQAVSERTNPPDSPLRVRMPTKAQWLSVLLVLALAVGVIRESRNADYEVAAVGELLNELATMAGPNDLVVLSPTAYVNYQLTNVRIEGDIRRGPWLAGERGLQRYLYLAHSLRHKSGRALFAVGHWNPPMRQHWEQLSQALSTQGRFTKVWSGHMVAIYALEP